MAIKTSTLRIWSHVRQVGPLSSDPNGDAWFAFNLTPVLVDDNGTVTVDSDLSKKYLWPWIWQWSELRVAVLANGVVQAIVPVASGQILRETPLTNLNTELQAEWNAVAANFDPARFTESLKNPAATATMDEHTPRNWKLYLYHASSYAGDIPLRAGLAAFFHVPYSQLGNADEIVAAPVFSGNPFSTTRAPLPPAGNCLDLSQAAATCPLFRMTSSLDTPAPAKPNYVTRWSYSAPASGELQVEWIEPYTPLRIPNTSSWTNGWTFFDQFIHEDTLWIEPAAVQGQDWHEHLELRVASLFDLPLRLLEWANQPGRVPDGPFGDAFVATLRDVLQAGLLVRPEGSTLALDVARIIAPQQTAGVLTALSQFTAQYDQFAPWLQRLTTFLTSTGQLGDNELVDGWQKPVADLSTYLARLNKIRNTLLDQDLLRAFIEAEWSDALVAAGMSALWTTAQSNVDTFLRDIDLVATLRLGFLGAAWNKQTGDWYDRTKIAAAMTDALQNVYRERLGLAPQKAWGYDSLKPRADGATSSKQADIESYLKSFVEQWARSATGPQPSADEIPDYSRGNHGINVQFSKFGTLSDADDAFLGQLRGAGVMLRPSTPKPDGTPYNWTVLNLGQYSIRGEAVRDSRGLLQAPAFDLTRVAVSAWQIAYRNGQLQVTCTYKNQPLSSRSPASDLSKVRYVKSLDASPGNGLFELWNAYRGASPYRLARLVFGQTYDAASFAVGFAGEMPKEICDLAKPWRAGADPSKWSAPKIKPAIPFLRTIPIGLVRVEGTEARPMGQDMARLSVPPIPEGVYPIARSIMKLDDQKDTLLLLSDLNDSKAQWTVQATNRADFAIRPPASDLATWDSWPIQPPPSAADRGAIYSFLAQNSDIQNDATKSAAPDLTLDDPAVSGFDLMLECEYAPPGQSVPAKIPATFAVRRNGASTLNQYQSAAAPVHVKVGAAPGLSVPKVAADPYEVNVTVPAGFVFRLSIQPVVSINAKNLFVPPLQKALLEPRVFHIEVATGFTADGTIPGLLNDSLVLSPSGQPLSVDLDLVKLAHAFGDSIHRVELMIQRWRWQGRPLARLDSAGNTVFDFPFDASAQPGWPDTVLEPLDGLYFGERDSNDHLLVSAQADALSPAAQNPRLYSNDLTGSPQALYYRFAVRVFSRYEGLLRAGTSVESRYRPAQISQGKLVPLPELWRRWVTICRRTAQAKPPAVRLVIPLTQTRALEQTPGLLVVLDEPWFEWAGLAERFNAQIVSVKEPVQGMMLPEAGPDPIVSNPKDPGPAGIEQSLAPVGPIGFTFDTNTGAPLFDKTSFVLPAPRMRAKDGTLAPADLSWWFLKLQFQRTLQPAGTSAYSSSLDSVWTAPMEVQFLPAANLWYTQGQGRQNCGDLRFSFTPTFGAWQE